MNTAEHREISDSLVDQLLDFSQEIAALRLLGAEQFDPVHLHYLEELTQRVDTHQGPVKHILGEKLVQALVAFRTRLEQTQRDTSEAIAQATRKYPQARAELQQLHSVGDFPGVRRRIATLERSGPRESLGDLVRAMTQPSSDPVDARLQGHTGSHAELKSVKYFRNTWSKLSADKQVTQALDQAPKNAGPINSNRLVLHSLALMRDISPDYLNRFVSYVDTLICLDQRGEDKQANAKKAPLGGGSPKIKSRRSQAR